MNFRSLIIGALLIGLFSISLYSFSVVISNENQANMSLQDNSNISYYVGNINSLLNTSVTQANNSKQRLEEETKHPILTTLGFVFTSILTAGSLFTDSTLGLFSTIGYFMESTLAVNPVITGTLIAILVISLVLAAWRVYRSGE